MASKRLRVSATSENIDRISDLPDAVLSHILSFMPTVCSVRTRVLSTRWKHLFSLVPVLDFFFPPASYSADRIRRYLDFINSVFNSYNVDQMDRFSYNSKEFLPESSRLLSWISDSVRRRVRELDITYFFREPQTLPRGVFTCERLTVLTIRANFNLDVPEDMCFPCIRKIYLMRVSFVDGVSAGRLFRSCPMLEDLSLWSCHMGDTQFLELSVPTLKCLKMHRGRGYMDKYDLVLNAPNVEYFEYSGKEARGFHAVQGLKLLAKACISFRTYSYKGNKALKKLVSVVCHVRHISFCAFTLLAFQKSAQPLPVFRNLIHLEIKDVRHFDSRLVLSILDRIPHLEVLVVDNGWFSEEEYSKLFRHNYLLLEDVPACVSLHLKEVEFRHFLMLEHEFQLVEYFLKNAKILETVRIRSVSRLEKLYEVNKKLLTLPRCSRACRIVV